MASIVLRRVSTRASIWYATTRSDNGLDISLGVATPATGAADCILAAEEMHRLAIIRTNSRAEQRSMFLSLNQILPHTVHNESLVELRSLHRRSKLGKVWRASPLYSRHSLPNFSSRTFASWGARRIWIGINTTSAIHSLGDCKTRINPRI